MRRRLLICSYVTVFLCGIACAIAQEPTSNHSQQNQTFVSADVSSLKLKAEGGDVDAQVALARAYETGEGVTASDEMAAKWYLMAAQQGDATAQNEIGIMYRTGRGVAQNKTIAAQWYAKAASQGLAAGQFNLAVASYNGDGVPTDDQAAYILFVLAQEGGSQQASEAVARTESEHPKVWVDNARRRLMKVRKGEVSTYQAQARSGNQYAMYRLGKMYAAGLGVKRDDVKAYTYFRLAEMRRMQGAKDQLEELARRLDTKKIANAEKMAQQWH